MLRTAGFSVSVLFGIVLFGFVQTAVADALPMQLKTGASVTEDVIRVGDLWDNAGNKADLAIAKAPQPGQLQRLGLAFVFAVRAHRGRTKRANA